MTTPTNSAPNRRGPLSRIAGRKRLFQRRHRGRKPAPPSTGPVFRKVWKEVAPGKWQLLHIYDEQDQDR
jgi:hypothetical protein